MRRVLKYLGRNVWLLVLALCCVAGQAILELQLPDQMGRLVNIGIQAHGVADCAPDRITARDMDLASLFMSGLGREHAQGAYRRDGNVYVRDDLDASELQRVNNTFSIASCAMAYAAHAFPGEAGDVMESSSKADLSEADVNAICDTLVENEPLSVWLVSSSRSKALALHADLREQLGQAMAGGFFEAAGGSLEHKETQFMLGGSGELFGIAATAMAFSVLVSVLAARVSSSLAAALRGAMFDKVSRLDAEQAAQFTEASLVARTTSDITLVQTFTMASIRIMAFALLMGIGGAALASWKNPQLAVVLALAIVGDIAVIWLIFRLTRPMYRTVQKMIDRLTLVTREQVDGAATVRAYAAEGREEERFDKANEVLADTQLRINRRLIFLAPTFTLISNLVGLFIVWNGAFQVQGGTQLVGDVIAYVQYAGVALAGFALVAGMFIVVPRVSVAANRILEVLDAPERKRKARTDSLGEKGIRFDNVVYSYPGCREPALRGVSLTAEPGRVTAVVGRTGCGKSTLCELVERFRDAQQGAIYLDGQDISAMDPEKVRSAISYVPQRTDWGVRWGGIPAGDGQAGRLPTSGHGRAVLNALERAAGVCVVDDALLGLDPGPRVQAMNRLRELGKRGSVLLLSHSVRVARKADLIYVMEDGRITASGTHEQLMRDSGLYKRLADAEDAGGVADA